MEKLFFLPVDLPLYIFFFLISLCIRSLRVNLGHRSPRMILGGHWSVWLLGHIFGRPPLLLPGLEPASPGPSTVLTRVCCLSLNQTWLGSTPPSRLQNKRQGAVMRISFEQSLRPDASLNSDMVVAYITDCATSPANFSQAPANPF